MSGRIFAFWVALAAGCGAGQSPPEGEGRLIDAGAEMRGPDEPVTRPPAGVIRRAELRALLDEGPAALLARVSTEPFRQGARFVGFEIKGFPKGEPRVIDVRVGDVIVSINGRPMGDYNKFYEVFNELRVASEIRFEIIRAGQKTTLVYPIAD